MPDKRKEQGDTADGPLWSPPRAPVLALMPGTIPSEAGLRPGPVPLHADTLLPIRPFSGEESPLRLFQELREIACL